MLRELHTVNCRLIVIACCLLFLTGTGPLPSWGADFPVAGKVTVQADTMLFDEKSDTVSAVGMVKAYWQETMLKADSAVFDRSGTEATASGHVELTRNGDRLTADRLKIGIDTQVGEVENGNLFLKQPNFYLRGARLAKTGPADYRLAKGFFTTCDGDSPSWHFTADDLELTMEEYATGRHAVFSVGSVPVFYLPYVMFPVKTERQSGFLFPRLGSSGKKGAYLDIPWYWAISPSRDATIDLDLQSKRGAGVGVDYRYLGGSASEARMKGYLIYDTSQERTRGDLNLQLKENRLPVLFKADVQQSLDRDYYRDFGIESGEYNRQYLDTSLSLSRSWHDYGAALEFRTLDSLELATNDATLQRIPRLTVDNAGERVGTLPVFFSLEAGATNFYRAAGSVGQRLEIAPRLTWQQRLLPGIGLETWGGFRQRLYHADRSDSGEGWRGAGLAEGGAALHGRFARIFPVAWGDTLRVRHELQPEIGYRVIESADQSGLPFFDYDDRPVGGEQIYWSIANLLTSRSGEGDATRYRELLSMRLSQAFQLSGGRRDLLTLVDDGRRLTDLRLDARAVPVEHLAVTADTRFSFQRGDFSTAAVGFEADDNKGNLAGLSYRFGRDQLEYLEGKLAVARLKPFTATYGARYSFDRPGFLESLYTVEYKHQCWSLMFSFRDRPDNRELMVTFALAGVGALGPVRAF